MKTITTLVLLICWIALRGQNDFLPKSYYVDLESIKEHIENGIPDEFKKDERHRLISHCFANEQAHFITNLISSGFVYTDKPEIENYLNDVLHKILPNELKNDSVIKVFLVKKGNVNAGVAASGHIFINIGVFSKAEDEATLASLIAHELGHYYQNHLIRDFTHEETRTFEGFIGADDMASRYYIKNELECDSLATIWLHNANYSLSGCQESFHILQRLENKYFSQSSRKVKPRNPTHPLAINRLNLVNRCMESIGDSSGEKYMVSEEIFQRIKKETKIEVLKLLLEDHKYQDCAELAFLEHAKDPTNKDYIYYILEGIRRRCYLQNKEWRNLFITGRYYNPRNDNGRKSKYNIPLLAKLDTNILGFSAKDISEINRKYYWNGNVFFKTNEEAYNFYLNLGNSLDCNECKLSNALSYSSHKQTRDSLLLEYVNLKPKPEFYDFALALMENSIFSQLSENKLLVYDNIETTISKGYVTIPIDAINKNSIHLQKQLFKTVSEKLTNRIPIYLDGLKNGNLKEYMLFKQLKDFSRTYIISEGKRAEMHILDPRYYILFQKYKVQEIEFIDSRYNEYYKKDKSIIAYDAVLNTDLNDFLHRNQGTRYLETTITSVREIENSVLKVRYFGDEEKLNFKGLGKYELERILVEVLRDKDKKTKLIISNMDYYNR